MKKRISQGFYIIRKEKIELELSDIKSGYCMGGIGWKGVYMPEIKKEFLDKINKCSWFCNCGDDITNIDFDVKKAENAKKAVRSINSLNWENTCLDIRGNFTRYLFKNHRDIYNRDWNVVVENVKNNYLEPLVPEMEAKLSLKNIKGDIIDDVKFNLLTLFMLKYYSDYYRDEFWDKMLRIYLSGHLPCGWVGKYTGGKFVVY